MRWLSLVTIIIFCANSAIASEIPNNQVRERLERLELDLAKEANVFQRVMLMTHFQSFFANYLTHLDVENTGSARRNYALLTEYEVAISNIQIVPSKLGQSCKESEENIRYSLARMIEDPFNGPLPASSQKAIDLLRLICRK